MAGPAASVVDHATPKRSTGRIVAGTLLGVVITLVDFDPTKVLFWAAVINGIVAAPLMIVMMVMTMQLEVMGQFTLPRPLWVIGWFSTTRMTAAVITMFLTWRAS